MNETEALKNLQVLINAAVVKGIFQDATAVIQMQQSLEVLKDALQKTSIKKAS